MKQDIARKIEGIVREMQKNGFRRSRSREGILRILALSKNPLSVAAIMETLQKERASLNKTTVYREIALLADLGYVKKLTLKDDKALYEMDMSHHHHLVCTDCGEVRHIDLKESLCKEERRIAKKEQFVIREHILEFFGVCRKCQSR